MRDQVGAACGVAASASPLAGGDWCCVLLMLAVHGVHAPILAGYYFPRSLMRKVNLYASTNFCTQKKWETSNGQLRKWLFPLVFSTPARWSIENDANKLNS